MALVALPGPLVAAVYTVDGDHVADVEAFIIDPDVGVVRFVKLQSIAGEEALLPWAAMNYAKSGAGFVLTRQGEEALASRVSDSPGQ